MCSSSTTTQHSSPSRPSWASLLIATFAFSIVQIATFSPLHRQQQRPRAARGGGGTVALYAVSASCKSLRLPSSGTSFHWALEGNQ